MNLIRLALYPIGFAVAGIAGWWHKRKQKIAEVWPAVEGQVQFCNVEPVQDSSSCSVTLQYSYFVEEYRSGEYTEVFDSESDADKFAQMMKGQKVPVRYNPRKLDDSLIEEADVEQYAPLPPPPHYEPLK
jgi:hypothetical protein